MANNPQDFEGMVGGQPLEAPDYPEVTGVTPASSFWTPIAARLSSWTSVAGRSSIWAAIPGKPAS